MKDVRIFNKDELLVFIINECSNNCNYKVTVELDEDGCWLNKFAIEGINKEE